MGQQLIKMWRMILNSSLSLLFVLPLVSFNFCIIIVVIIICFWHHLIPAQTLTTNMYNFVKTVLVFKMLFIPSFTTIHKQSCLFIQEKWKWIIFASKTMNINKIILKRYIISIHDSWGNTQLYSLSLSQSLIYTKLFVLLRSLGRLM